METHRQPVILLPNRGERGKPISPRRTEKKEKGKKKKNPHPKRNPKIAIVAAVDPHHAGLDAPRHTMRLGDILGEDGAAEAVGGIIRPAERLLLGLEARDDDEGAEDLFAVDFHIVPHVRENGGGDEEALAGAVDVLVRFAARGQGGAFAFPALDVGEDFLVLRFGDLWALEGLFLEGVAHFGDGLDLLFEEGDEFLVDAFLHQDPARCGADLAHVRHDAHVRPFDRLLQIRVVEDQQRALAARLQGDVLHVHGRHLHNLPSCRRAPREGNLVHIQMARECRARFLTDPVQDVHHPGWEAGLFDQGREIQGRKRGLLRGLQHHRVPCRERGTELPRGHSERVVPGDDLPAYPQRFAQRVGQLVGPRVDDLAVQLVRVAGVIAQGAGDFGDVFVQGHRVGFTVVYGCFRSQRCSIEVSFAEPRQCTYPRSRS